MPSLTELLVHRDDLTDRYLRTRPLPEPATGAALLVVDRVALSANNVTYARLGRSQHYWDLFPTGVESHGVVPAWGFATVLASGVVGVPVGARYYGLWPLADHVLVRPTSVRADGFTDGSPHRRTVHPLYHRYTDTATDPVHNPAMADLEALLRPLYITSFVLDDVLASRRFDGATTVLLSSASSRTALGTAQRLSRRTGVRVVGLTSARNMDLVRDTGWYSHVVDYDDVATLHREPTVYLDFAGSSALRVALHQRLGRHLVLDWTIGATAPPTGTVEPAETDSRTEFFFAPDHIRRLSAERGRDAFATDLADAWHDLARAMAGVITMSEARGPVEIVERWDDVVAGRTRPDVGVVLSW